jgi:hypothetical protein
MKIICENMNEYDKLIRASKYLHDFKIDFESFIDLDTGQIDKELIFGINDNEDSIIEFLQHLYLTEDDFPNKRDIILIESKHVDNHLKL